MLWVRKVYKEGFRIEPKRIDASKERRKGIKKEVMEEEVEEEEEEKGGEGKRRRRERRLMENKKFGKVSGGRSIYKKKSRSGERLKFEFQGGIVLDGYPLVLGVLVDKGPFFLDLDWAG